MEPNRRQMQIADVRMMNENGKPHSVTLLDGSFKMIEVTGFLVSRNFL